MAEFPEVVYWGLFLMRNLDTSLTPINCCQWRSVFLNCDRESLSTLRPVLGDVATCGGNEPKRAREFIQLAVLPCFLLLAPAKSFFVYWNVVGSRWFSEGAKGADMWK